MGNKALDHAMKGTVPYYNQIKKVMPQVNTGRQREHKPQGSGQQKKRLYLLTEHSPSGKAVLRKGVTVTQAAKKLSAYEATGLTPQEVLNLMERERNLTQRLIKMEDWG